MVKKLFFIATLLYIGATVSAENYLVTSPDGKIVAELNTNKYLSLQFKYNGSILTGVFNRCNAERWNGHG